MHFIYVLLSIKHNRIYIGISDNLKRRLQEHNFGQTKSTKAFRPYKIILTEQYSDRIKARWREKYLKSGCGRDWIKLNFMGQ